MEVLHTAVLAGGMGGTYGLHGISWTAGSYAVPWIAAGAVFLGFVVLGSLLLALPPGRDRREPEVSGDGTPSPEVLSRQIVERAHQIRVSLLERPSEIEVEMCLMGYRACAEDMVTLARLVEEECRSAGPLRRLRLVMARRRAGAALSRARHAVPPESRRLSHR